MSATVCGQQWRRWWRSCRLNSAVSFPVFPFFAFLLLLLPLCPRLRAQDPSTRRSSEDILESLQSTNYQVLRLRGEEEDLVKIRLLEALGHIGDPSCVADLVQFLDDGGRVEQSPFRSSIAAYPANTSVSDVASWAIRKILDGKPPIPIEKLAVFPLQKAWIEKQARKTQELKAWWEAHRQDARYSLDR